jgi:hypothetical protein
VETLAKGDEVKIPYSEIENAFFYVGSQQPFMNGALLDKATGQIYYRSEMGDSDEIPEEVRESDSAVEIPHQKDLELGRNLVFAFAESLPPEDYDHVRDIFRRKGAYSRYKAFLESKGLLQKWYDFENEAQEKAIRAWCKDHQIELVDNSG